MTVKSQVSLLDLTLEASIPDNVMWPLMDGKHSVSVSHHDGFLVDRVADGLDEEINGMAADFAMWLTEGTLAALDRTAREVKWLSKVNDWQTGFESVVLSVRVGVFVVLCHLDSSNDTTRHDDSWWFCSALSCGLIDGSFVEHIYPVLIFLLDVK